MIELSNSEKVAGYLKSQIQRAEVEEFWVMALNPQCVLIESRMLFRGTVDHCFIHPRDVFRFGILHNASFLIVGHNHPSGNCVPSIQDVKMTRRLMTLGRLIQIPVLDHVIVDSNGAGFYTFNGQKRLPDAEALQLCFDQR